jgi:hypothetical protein
MRAESGMDSMSNGRARWAGMIEESMFKVWRRDLYYFPRRANEFTVAPGE